MPNVVTSPATSNSSLTAIGTPSSGRWVGGLPALLRASAWSASIRARSGKMTLNAFSLGLYRAIRSR